MIKVVSFVARARENAAAQSAGYLADRLAVDTATRDRIVADTRALVRKGCSAAWALRTARRVARRAARTSPERA